MYSEQGTVLVQGSHQVKHLYKIASKDMLKVHILNNNRHKQWVLSVRFWQFGFYLVFGGFFLFFFFFIIFPGKQSKNIHTESKCQCLCCYLVQNWHALQYNGGLNVRWEIMGICCADPTGGKFIRKWRFLSPYYSRRQNLFLSHSYHPFSFRGSCLVQETLWV